MTEDVNGCPVCGKDNASGNWARETKTAGLVYQCDNPLCLAIFSVDFYTEKVFDK